MPLFLGGRRHGSTVVLQSLGMRFRLRPCQQSSINNFHFLLRLAAHRVPNNRLRSIHNNQGNKKSPSHSPFSYDLFCLFTFIWKLLWYGSLIITHRQYLLIFFNVYWNLDSWYCGLLLHYILVNSKTWGTLSWILRLM